MAKSRKGQTDKQLQENVSRRNDRMTKTYSFLEHAFSIFDARSSRTRNKRRKRRGRRSNQHLFLWGEFPKSRIL